MVPAESELREVFALLDANGDGKVSARELQVALGQVGASSSAASAALLLQQVDTDGNGFIELDELLLAVKKQLTETAAEDRQLRAAFQDHNGFIEAEELRTMMRSLGESLSEEQAREMIREGDLDGDRRISFQEFIMLIKG